MAEKSQSRKWQLTINNPVEHEFTDELIRENLLKFAPDYYCMCKEIGNHTQTYHIHIFIYSTSPIRFTTLKKRFPIAHIEKAYGSIRENVDYIKKEGKWKETDKTETVIEGSFEEFGIMPTDGQDIDPIMSRLLNDIKNNLSTVEIIEQNPKLAFKIKDIDTIRQTYLAEKYLKENRDLVVTYIYGATGVGKTRDIFKKYGAENICRITNYKSSRGVMFDSYNTAQDVLVFEEFHSQIPIEDMLNYLDIYPIMLPARYNDRVSCFTKVFITSNVPFGDQYREIKYGINDLEVLRAFERRVHNILEYKRDGTIIEHKKTKVEELENEKVKNET